MARRVTQTQTQTDIVVEADISLTDQDGKTVFIAETPGYSLYDSHIVEPITPDDVWTMYVCVSKKHSPCQSDNPTWIFKDRIFI